MLVVDCDPQASLTISLGNPQPDRLPVTLSDMMGKMLTGIMTLLAAARALTVSIPRDGWQSSRIWVY